jgi:hypothetical protein
VNGQGATVTQTSGTYASADAGANDTVTATLASGNFSAANGTLLSNYILPTSAMGAGTINQAPLTPAPTPSPAPTPTTSGAGTGTANQAPLTTSTTYPNLLIWLGAIVTNVLSMPLSIFSPAVSSVLSTTVNGQGAPDVGTTQILSPYALPQAAPAPEPEKLTANDSDGLKNSDK